MQDDGVSRHRNLATRLTAFLMAALILSASGAWGQDPDPASRQSPATAPRQRTAENVARSEHFDRPGTAAAHRAFPKRTLPLAHAGELTLGVTDDEAAYTAWLHPALRL